MFTFGKSRAAISPGNLAKYHQRSYPADTRWTWAKHLFTLDGLLLDAIAGKHARLLLSLPPRHGKSTLASIYLSAWYLGKNPDHHIILTAHTHDLAASFSNKAKGVLADVGEEVFGIEIDPKVAARDNWQIKGRQGGMTAAGIGGPILGRGANLLLIDDPVKNAEEAKSAVYREQFRDWFLSTAMSRLEPGGVVILTAARWTIDDPIGWLLSQPEKKWHWVNFPAIATGDKSDPLKRKKGEALWPRRWPIESLDAKRADVGSRWFEANYQGNPLPAETAAFKPAWIRLVDEPPPVDETIRCRGWDTASSESKTADYTAGVRVSYHAETGLYFIEHVIRAKLSPGALKRRIGGTARSDGYETAVRIEQEPGGSGLIAAEALLEELSDYDTGSVRATGSKESRWQPLAAAMENGKVYIVADGAWAEEFIEELLHVPSSAHDDMVDATSLAFSELRKCYR